MKLPLGGMPLWPVSWGLVLSCALFSRAKKAMVCCSSLACELISSAVGCQLLAAGCILLCHLVKLVHGQTDLVGCTGLFA